MFSCQLQNDPGGFAVESLGVQFPFTGDDEVCPLDLFFYLGFAEKEVRARAQLSIVTTVQPRPDGTGRTAPGNSGN